jgi:hypothetical protein
MDFIPLSPAQPLGASAVPEHNLPAQVVVDLTDPVWTINPVARCFHVSVDP